MRAVALGNFDGVHLGHRRILEAVRLHAAEHGLEPIALTFDPHPRHFFDPESKVALLTPAREKAALIAGLGVGQVTLAFDAELAALSAEDFIREILVGRLRAEAFFIGPGHRFGRGALGTAELLRETRGAGSVFEIEPIELNGEIVSSSAVRRLLETGDPKAARRMLGRAYALDGTVVRGRERGRQLGFPTANLRLEDPRKILPAFGVYGGYARFNGERRPAVANIGLRPTFSEPEPSVEVHIPDWDGDLYGQFMEFEVIQSLRPEKKFDSVEALRQQITDDVRAWKTATKTGPGL